MCGIAGIFRPKDAPANDDASLIERMTDVLRHRGPNDRGTWHHGPVSLGHRRLSVIDLSPSGRQPMGNEDGSVQISFNGEIYNFRELKQKYQLEAKGHVFRSRTDTEVMVHLYEELGTGMFRELNGMFGLALWDGRRQLLHLARDPFGVKPLFYAWHEGKLYFGSEIKSILQVPTFRRKVDLQALHDFLTFDYIPGEQTAFEGVREVPPGFALTVNLDGGTHLERFWEPSYREDDSITDAEAIAKSRELLEQAVRRQLVADVPIGVLLSGGMDSSTLVALMARQTQERIHTYSVGFEDQSFNELPAAQVIARKFNTAHREVVITPQLVREMLPRYLDFIDEPYADGSAIPTYYVCQLAKDEVVVVLSGEGGDEAFSGYETHAAYKVSQWFKWVPRLVRNGLIRPLVNLLPVSHKKLSLEFKLKRFLGGQDLEPAQAHLWWRIVLSEAQKRELYSPAVLEQLEPRPSDRHFAETFKRAKARDVLNRLLYIDTSVFLPDDLMIKNDRMSMAHSLEARVPMTDPDLTEYLSRVPAKVKLPGLRKKHLMRKAVEGLLPKEIIDKKKVGLEMPYSRWFRSELKDVLERYTAADRVQATGLFRPESVRRIVEEHQVGRFDHGRALWGLLNFMMWHERYIG